MDRETALHFGIGLSVFSVVLMGVAINWFSAAFLAFSIFFYAVVYTIWLKRSTPQNIVIGGAAGALAAAGVTESSPSGSSHPAKQTQSSTIGSP